MGRPQARTARWAPLQGVLAQSQGGVVGQDFKQKECLQIRALVTEGACGPRTVPTHAEGRPGGASGQMLKTDENE